MVRENPAESKSRNVVLSQQVSNPVGNDDNTDIGSGDPGNITSGPVSLVPGVIHPVGNEMNTGRGKQEPLPMRPIPS
jgi:hypothetical protein